MGYDSFLFFLAGVNAYEYLSYPSGGGKYSKPEPISLTLIFDCSYKNPEENVKDAFQYVCD